MPIYHYHATKQVNPGSLVQIDGIAITQKPVICMDGYAELKKLIADYFDIGGPEGLTIDSLTVLQADT